MLRGDRNWISKGEICCKLFPSGNKNSYQECRRVAEATYLLMYSPVRTFPQALHLKHPRCHCLSRASNACPFFMSLPQPAQSANKQTNAFAVSYLVHWCSLTTQRFGNQRGKLHSYAETHLPFLRDLQILHEDTVFFTTDIFSRGQKSLSCFSHFVIQRLLGKLCTNLRFCWEAAMNHHPEKYQPSKGISIFLILLFARSGVPKRSKERRPGQAPPGCCSLPLGGSKAQDVHPATGGGTSQPMKRGESIFSKGLRRGWQQCDSTKCYMTGHIVFHLQVWKTAAFLGSNRHKHSHLGILVLPSSPRSIFAVMQKDNLMADSKFEAQSHEMPSVPEDATASHVTSEILGSALSSHSSPFRYKILKRFSGTGQFSAWGDLTRLMWDTAGNHQCCVGASRERTAWQSSEAERECPSTGTCWKPVTTQNKGFSVFYYPNTLFVFFSFSPCVGNINKQPQTKTSSSWLYRYSSDTIISSQFYSPGNTTPCKRATPDLLSQLTIKGVSPFDTQGPDFCLLDNGRGQPQIDAVHSC